MRWTPPSNFSFAFVFFAFLISQKKKEMKTERKKEWRKWRELPVCWELVGESMVSLLPLVPSSISVSNYLCVCANSVGHFIGYVAFLLGPQSVVDRRPKALLSNHSIQNCFLDNEVVRKFFCSIFQKLLNPKKNRKSITIVKYFHIFN